MSSTGNKHLPNGCSTVLQLAGFSSFAQYACVCIYNYSQTAITFVYKLLVQAESLLEQAPILGSYVLTDDPFNMSIYEKYTCLKNQKEHELFLFLNLIEL